MKKFAIAVVAVCAMSGMASCQEKETFDLFAVVGYGFGMGGRDLGASATYSTGTTLTKKTDNYINYGAGLKVEGGASYKLMQHLYGQAALSYSNGLLGIKKEVVNEQDGNNDVTDQYNFSTLGIKLLAKPTFQILDLFNAYTSFGIGLYFAFSSIDHKESIGGLSAHADDNNWPAFAFVGALGLEYPLNKSVIIFGEVYCEEMGFMLHERTVTKSNIGYEPWENGTTTYAKNSKDEHIKTPENTPGSNAAVRVGVRFPLF
jgi:opacity protein-like surface antigen